MADGEQRPGCAACEFIERTCPPDCLLAPHYPPECEPHFSGVKILMNFDSPVESVIRRSTLPILRQIQAETIADDVGELGNYSSEARRLLAEALLDEVAKRIRHCPEERRRQTLHGLLLRGAISVGPEPWTPMPTRTTTVAVDDEGPDSLRLDRLEIDVVDREEPAERRGGRELTPAEAAVMALIWDSFVEAMELPLELAVMELQQSGVLAVDDDYGEPGPSDQDCKEESFSGTKNEEEEEEEEEEEGNNHKDIA